MVFDFIMPLPDKFSASTHVFKQLAYEIRGKFNMIDVQLVTNFHFDFSLETFFAKRPKNIFAGVRANFQITR